MPPGIRTKPASKGDLSPPGRSEKRGTITLPWQTSLPSEIITEDQQGLEKYHPGILLSAGNGAAPANRCSL